MKYFKIRSHAKINLALNVVGKSKSLHRIESLISFIDLHDVILIRKINDKNHKIKFVGKFSKGIKKKNSISQLLEIIDQKKLAQNRKFEIKIIKNIPLKSGMGGGSMNAASLLNFFLKKKIFKLNNLEIINICQSIGSDVILGINFQNTILSSNNKIARFKKIRILKFFIYIF